MVQNGSAVLTVCTTQVAVLGTIWEKKKEKVIINLGQFPSLSHGAAA